MEYKLEILGESPRSSLHKRVVARCVCGNIKTYQQSNLRSGQISCGCKPRKGGDPRHGMDGTPVHRAWILMRRRCTNQDYECWHRYGGRGIAVCERWQTFENFYEDMGEKPEGKQLDRIDNDEGYFPGNCRWVTPKENCNNRGNCIKVDFGYFQLTVDELAELGVICRTTIYRRWHKYENAWDCLFPPN